MPVPERVLHIQQVRGGGSMAHEVYHALLAHLAPQDGDGPANAAAASVADVSLTALAEGSTAQAEPSGPGNALAGAPASAASQSPNQPPLGSSPHAAVRPGATLSGFLLNPMYAPGAIWSRVLSLQPRARLVWLRRTNLVKMALSDLRRI